MEHRKESNCILFIIYKTKFYFDIKVKLKINKRPLPEMFGGYQREITEIELGASHIVDMCSTT